jgi:hypothetical protein
VYVDLKTKICPLRVRELAGNEGVEGGGHLVKDEDVSGLGQPLPKLLPWGTDVEL